MKKWLFLVPVAATIGAIAANLPGFILGGPREWWELIVSGIYLVLWTLFLFVCPVRWQRIVSIIWWAATTVCAAAAFAVVTFDFDGFLLMFPAMGFITPLSGLAVVTGRNYPLFYGLCTVFAVIYTFFAARRRERL